ncbi:MAG: hypothetical protein RLZZ324_1301, partial [Candidatus Parcubacteria bacterium]
DYGLTAGPPYGSTLGASTPLQTSHSVALTGLSEATTYHYSVRSLDASGNTASTADASFTTLDATAPVISAIAVTLITPTTARVTWTTNEASTSVVVFGPTIAYGTTTSDPTLVTAHQVDITGLTPDSTVHFAVKSADASGNLATSADGTFVTPKPAAPVISAIAVSLITQTTARVTWTTTAPSSSTVNYGGTVTYGSSATSATLVTSHLINLTGLTKGASYHFRVRSTDAYAQETVSTDGTFTTVADTAPPANVSGFAATPGDSHISLVWTNPADADFAGVRIMRKTTGMPTGPADGTMAYSGTAETFNDTGLTNGVTYYYAAFSFDDVPNYASGAVVTATPAGPPDTTPPGNITGFTATAGDANISLSWSNPSDIDFAGVRIMRKSGSAPSGVNDGTLAYQGTGTTVNDPGLTNGTQFYYRAFTFDAVPNYSSGADASATPSAPRDTTPPAAATNLTAAAGDAMIQLAWTNPSDPDWAGTRVVRKAGSAPSSANDGTIVYDGNSDNRLDPFVQNGITYHYAAYAYDAQLNFASPARVTATPSAGAPPPPAPACTDADGGQNYDISSSVVSGGVTYADSCSDATTVNEQYCQSGAHQVDVHACGTGSKCSGGRCVPDTFVPTTEVCGNGICAASENSINCPSDCPFIPIQPQQPVAKITVPPDEKLRLNDLRFYATAGKIALRVENDTMRTFNRMTFTVKIPDESIKKRISTAFVNFAGTSFVMRQTASFETTVTGPDKSGSYPLTVSVHYEDGTADSSTVTIISAPRGKVYETSDKGDVSVSGARVALYVNKGNGNYGLWDGSVSHQENPQITDDNGQFSYVVPVGTYQLVVTKDGYGEKQTLPFPIGNENVITNAVRLIKFPQATPVAQAQYVASVVSEQVQEVIQNPFVEQQTQHVAAPVAVATAAVNVASAGAAASTAIPYLTYLYSLLAHPTLLIARRRR